MKPIPPETIRSVKIPKVKGWVLNLSTLSGKIENPALQKAETAWKAAVNPGASTPILSNSKKSKKDPKHSINRVKNTIFRTIFIGSYSTPSTEKLLIVFSRRKGSLPPGIVSSIEVNEMIPKPPNCIKSIMIVCPKREKPDVSAVTSPVTHTAEAEVKRVSIKASLPGYADVPTHAAGR